MSLTTEIEKTKRGLSLEKRCWFSPNWNTVQSKLEHCSVQTGTLFSHWVISEAIDLGFQFGLYG
jgi:hypothetical protein